MCRYVFLLLLGCMLAGGVYAQPTAGHGPLRRQVGKPLPEALKALQQKQDASFSFRSGSMDGIVVPELPDTMVTIAGFLLWTLRDSRLEVERIGDTFVIFKANGNAEQVQGLPEFFSLSGVVRDQSTDEALPFAAVAVAGTAITATTNTDGKFTLLNIPGPEAVLSVRYLGYKDLDLRMVPEMLQGQLLIDMERQDRLLPSVEVTAHREQMLKVGKKVGQLAFNPVDIARLPNLAENDLFAALRLLPGISNNTETTSGLRIRGSASDESLVLFDGITVYHVDHFFGFLSAFNSNVVKNVQVSKGGFDARYGGRTAGLVNITAIDGNKKDPALTLELGMLSANFLAELPIVEDKASITFAYRRAFTNVIRSPTYRNMFNNLFNSSIPNVGPSEIDVFDGDGVPDFSFQDLNAKFHFRPSDKDAISVSFYQGRDDLQIAFGARNDQITRISEDNTVWGNTGGSFKWSRKWNKRFYTYANFGLSRYRSDLTAEVTFTLDGDQLLSRRFFEQRVNLDDNTLRLDNTYELSSRSRLEFGLWHSAYRIGLQSQDQDFIFQDSLQQAQLTAGYLNYSRSFGRLDAKMGLRNSYYTADETFYPEPRISFNYTYSQSLSFKAAAGRYVQMIRRLNERSLYFSIPETWALAAQADVPVLQSDQFIVGANYTSGEWEADAEGYYKHESGIVEFLLPEFGIASGSLDQFAVGGVREVLGLDLMVRRNFRNQQIMLTYTWLDAQSQYGQINNGNPFKSLGVSTHEMSGVYILRHNRWDFSASIVLASGQPYTPVLGTFVVTLENGAQQQFVSLGEINSSRTDWIHRLDLAAGYTVPLKKGALKCGLSVYNVYNRQNVRFIDYFEIQESEGDLFTLGRREVYGLGITPSIFLRLKL